MGEKGGGTCEPEASKSARPVALKSNNWLNLNYLTQCVIAFLNKKNCSAVTGVTKSFSIIFPSPPKLALVYNICLSCTEYNNNNKCALLVPVKLNAY